MGANLSNDETELDPVERVVAMIAELDGDSYGRVIESLSPPHAYSEVDTLERALQKAGLDREDARSLVGFSVTAADAIETGDAEESLPVDMARRVAASLPVDEATAISRTSAIVYSTAIRLLARARNARVHRGNIVLGSAIETDVRPIFEPKYGTHPAIEVVSHSLRLTATSDLRNPGKERAYDFTLDHEDLVQLIIQAHRALDVQEAIHSRADATGTAVSLQYVANQEAAEDD